MNTEIKSINGPQFLIDLKRCSEVMVYAQETGNFFKTTKKYAIKAASETKGWYYLTDEIFVRKRISMVII